MLTVRSLATELGLELVAGQDAADAPLRWVHISELEDPTPWLSGGELLLTTGIGLTEADDQRAYVARLLRGNVAGLGFGTGFDHPALPDALREAADAGGLPLFEVPYEIPFIAITERAFTQLVSDQNEALRRAIALHRRLERLVLEGRGLDELVAAIASGVGGSALVISGEGEVLAEHAFRSAIAQEVRERLREQVRSRPADRVAPFVPEDPALAGGALVLPVPNPDRAFPAAWLAAAREHAGLGETERLVLQQAVTVVALELMRGSIVRDTERRLAGNVLTGALDGGMDAAELGGRLKPFGIGDRAFVVLVEDAEHGDAERRLDGALTALGAGALVARRNNFACAVVDAGAGDPLDVGRAVRGALGGDEAPRISTSRASEVGALRRAYHEARCALEATRFSNGTAPDVASYRDLGAFTLLLAVQDDEALRVYSESVLGPIREGDERYGGELLRSLEAFIEQNGQWEKAARTLYCHRHTLRYRIRRVEQLTGRDLSRVADRIELWLALRARELVA